MTILYKQDTRNILKIVLLNITIRYVEEKQKLKQKNHKKKYRIPKKYQISQKIRVRIIMENGSY